MSKIKNLIGSRFGRLTVIASDAPVGKHTMWSCQCDCGSVKSYYASNLTGGKSTSCGCKSSETLDKIRSGATKHGMSRTKTYKAWMSMKGRCLNPSYGNYANYGGRGIKVCDRWLESFENFLADMGEAPRGTSIDRIDNDGHYTPENCRWATDSEQQNNKRDTVLLTANGKTQTINEWAKETGLDVALIRNRIKRHGWSVEKAINTPKTEYKHD